MKKIEEKVLYVKIKHTYWREVSKELTPSEMRVLALMLGQKVGYKLLAKDLANKLGINLKQFYKLAEALKENNYIIKPKVKKINEGKFTTDGYMLQEKALQYINCNYGDKYEVYLLSDICDKKVNSYQWAIKAYLSCYSKEIRDIIENTRIERELSISRKTIAKYRVYEQEFINIKKNQPEANIEAEKETIYIEPLKSSISEITPNDEVVSEYNKEIMKRMAEEKQKNQSMQQIDCIYI